MPSDIDKEAGPAPEQDTTSHETQSESIATSTPSHHAKKAKIKKTFDVAKPANSEVMQDVQSSMLSYMEPVFVKPNFAPVPDLLNSLAQVVESRIPKTNKAKLVDDLKASFAHNLYQRTLKEKEQYFPGGVVRYMSPITVPFMVNDLVDAFSLCDDDKGNTPPLLLDWDYAEPALRNVGINLPYGFEILGVQSRMEQNMVSLTKDLPLVGRAGVNVSLLRSGIVREGTECYAVHCDKLTRTSELLAGALRMRAFNAPAEGVYIGTLKRGEVRAAPKLCAYFKSGRPYKERDFIFEYIQSVFRRS